MDVCVYVFVIYTDRGLKIFNNSSLVLIKINPGIFLLKKKEKEGHWIQLP